MKKILYYISDHGHGHATRSISIIKELQKKKIEVIIRNTQSIDIIKKSIPNCRIIKGITDVGPSVKKDGLTLDIKNSKKKIGDWIKSFEKTIDYEMKFVLEINPDLIISDISAMPFNLASKLKIPCIAISNFSWYDSLSFLTTKQSKILKESYMKADLAIQLPFGTKMNHFKKKIKVGIISRKVNLRKNEIIEQLKIKKKKRILLAMGNTNEIFTFDSKSDFDILSIGGKIRKKKIYNLVNYVNGHELVSISDLVICKIGYGIISECLTNGIPFIYTLDENRNELKQVSLELEKMKLGRKMTLDEINLLKIDSNFINSFEKSPKIINQNKIVAKIIIDFMKKNSCKFNR